MSPALADVLERSRDTSWEVRRASASELGALLPDDTAFARLVAMVDDPDDTAVGQQATVELVTHGGLPGLAAVAAAYATLDDDIGYIVSAVLGRLWVQDGYPLADNLRSLRSSDDPDVVRGAAELAEYLSAG